MSAGPLIAKLALTVVLCGPPAIILFSTEPPSHGSRWYPDPARWDYPIKLRLYAMMVANFGPDDQPLIARLLVKTAAATIMVMIGAALWLAIPCG